jgi:hypothetical protein
MRSRGTWPTASSKTLSNRTETTIFATTSSRKSKKPKPRKQNKNMPIVASRGGSFTPAPQGNHDAVFCDVEDLGEVETQYGKKHQIRLVWQIAEKMEDGRPFTIGRRYGLTLHEKAALFKDLKTYAKKAPPQNLDLETLIGKPCQILVTHAERDGSTYANVQAVLPAGANKIKVDKDFVRKCNRPGAPKPAVVELDADGTPVPF